MRDIQESVEKGVSLEGLVAYGFGISRQCSVIAMKALPKEQHEFSNRTRCQLHGYKKLGSLG